MSIYEKIVIAVKPVIDIDTIMAWDIEVKTAIVVAGVAGFALLATIVQGRQNHKHNRLSLRPWLEQFLEIKAENNASTDNNIVKYNFTIINNGVGPAVIKKVELLFKDKVVSCNNYVTYHDDLIKKMKAIKGFKGGKIGFIYPGSIMAVGDARLMWEFNFDIREDDIKFVDDLDLRVKYQSIYQGKNFIYDSRKARKFNYKETPIIFITQVAQDLADIHAACPTITRPWSAQEFANLLHNPRVFYGTHPSGFIIGRQVDAEEVELFMFVVVTEQQNKGIGRDLLTNFIDSVRNLSVRRIFLEVAENNDKALRMYKAAGFQEAGKRIAYYKMPDGTPIDGITMRLDIETP